MDTVQCSRGTAQYKNIQRLALSNVILLRFYWAAQYEKIMPYSTVYAGMKLMRYVLSHDMDVLIRMYGSTVVSKK